MAYMVNFFSFPFFSPCPFFAFSLQVSHHRIQSEFEPVVFGKSGKKHALPEVSPLPRGMGGVARVTAGSLPLPRLAPDPFSWDLLPPSYVLLDCQLSEYSYVLIPQTISTPHHALFLA